MQSLRSYFAILRRDGRTHISVKLADFLLYKTVALF